MTTLTLAVDLGGTNMRVALVDRRGRISSRRSVETLAREGRQAVMGRLIDLLERLVSGVEWSSLAGIGVSVAGATDPRTGTVHNAPNLPGWNGYSPKRALEERFALPASVANDANLAALAEHHYGAGRGHDNMVYITVSTGIGGGLVFDGRLYTGARGFAGEIGHITIDPKGPKCSCGNRGCLEVLASGTAMARIARERLASGEKSILTEWTEGDLDRIRAQMVADAAVDGDSTARAIVSQVSRTLGVGIVTILHALDPGIIVIGGGMSLSLELLLPETSRPKSLK